MSDAQILQYHGEDTAPNSDGLVLSVRLDGQEVGSLHCFNANPPGQPIRLRWHGKNRIGEGSAARSSASGPARDSRDEAAADVLDWALCRTPPYAADQAPVYLSEHSKYHTAAAPGTPYLVTP